MLLGASRWFYQMFFFIMFHGRADNFFPVFKSICLFLLVEFYCTFHQLLNTKILCLLLLYLEWDSLCRRDFVFLSCSLYFLPYSRLSSYLFRLFLCLISFLLFPGARVFGKTLVHEFHISYSQTEWLLLFSDSATTSAQCVFVVKNYK